VSHRDGVTPEISDTVDIDIGRIQSTADCPIDVTARRVEFRVPETFRRIANPVELNRNSVHCPS
jgi:hypothetical protein